MHQKIRKKWVSSSQKVWETKKDEKTRTKKVRRRVTTMRLAKKNGKPQQTTRKLLTLQPTRQKVSSTVRLQPKARLWV